MRELKLRQIKASPRSESGIVKVRLEEKSSEGGGGQAAIQGLIVLEAFIP